MSFNKFALAAIASLFLGGAAWAEGAPAATAPPAAADHHMMMHGMFTPEERMILFSDMYKATSGLSDDQKRDYRRQQRDRIMSMSDDERSKFKADLDARWNVLTDDQKAAMTAKIQAFMAARHGGGPQ